VKNIITSDLAPLTHPMSAMSDSEINSLLEFYICGCAILLCAVIGLSGNAACIFLFKFRKMKMNPTFTNLIVWLALIDSLFLVLISLSFSLPSLSPQYKKWIFPTILPSLLPLTSVTLTGSVYCVVALALERYLHLTRPSCSNKGSFFGYILPVLAFSVFYNAPKFFEFFTEYSLNENRELVPHVRATEFRKNVDYSFYVLGSNFIFMGLIPFSLLISLNIVISRKMDQCYPSSDQSMSLLLYCIVIVQTVCHAPRTALNTYEIYQALTGGSMSLSNPWLVDLSHLMLAISSASNVAIFALQDLRFRSLLVTDMKKALFLYRKKGAEEEHGVEDKLVGERVNESVVGERGMETVVKMDM